MKQMTLKRSDSPQIFYFFDELSLQIFMCEFLCVKLTDEVGVCTEYFSSADIRGKEEVASGCR